VNDVIQANTELRNEISRLPSKLDDLITTMKSFISLVEAAGKEEISTPTESLKPISEQLQKMIEQNQKLLESNQAILEQLDSMNRKLKGGTPVSHLLASYPRLKLRKEVR
jgi:uncharacterized coiled-coil protein SlyX